MGCINYLRMDLGKPCDGDVTYCKASETHSWSRTRFSTRNDGSGAERRRGSGIEFAHMLRDLNSLQ